eukprot:Pgem_evm1s13772
MLTLENKHVLKTTFVTEKSKLESNNVNVVEKSVNIVNDIDIDSSSESDNNKDKTKLIFHKHQYPQSSFEVESDFESDYTSDSAESEYDYDFNDNYVVYNDKTRLISFDLDHVVSLTYHQDAYERREPPIQRNPQDIANIRKWIRVYKEDEMEVHPESVHNTNYHEDTGFRKFYTGKKVKLLRLQNMLEDLESTQGLDNDEEDVAKVEQFRLQIRKLEKEFKEQFYMYELQ